MYDTGVYRRGVDVVPEFVEVPAPTEEALQAVLHKVSRHTAQVGDCHLRMTALAGPDFLGGVGEGQVPK
jgi:hypothetical protein